MAIIPYVLDRFAKTGSPVKWADARAYDTAPVRERAVMWADALVGIRETRGANRGWDVDYLVQKTGLNPLGAYAWCACFVYSCLILAGADPKALPPKGKAAAVRNWVSWAKEKGRLRSAPGRGRLFYILRSDNRGHIGFSISSWFNFFFRTIEGNTDGDAGSREGDGSYKRTRTRWWMGRFPQFGWIDLTDIPRA